MFTRIVKMEFQEEKIPQFLENFETVKHKIRNFKGCLFLELYRDKRDPTIFFTYSKWEEENALENYRNSELFKGVWATTKPMFRSKAAAWSVDTLFSGI
ncbi:antibiotic biosynthesis monooxygenase [Patiriisocius marinistellae]|uniref:Antibiotic biosynthesis monooxygenase n=1 Tax=Patiriisocius marinistellae TaxID=2494560 RepID=A0A5J4G376_9FLAO|nr:antibiotic biosynthesis monooxygenase family protein [Patiriisocius marinistellae]GEQ87175.1 antibiotic biosynthesis monooxygenase [Patiriisocius marinistellae]